MTRFLFFLLALPALAQQIRIDLALRLTPLEIDRISLGQGGLSEQPMWDDRVNDVRMLHPRIIRLFVQEYFDLLPASGTYHWHTLDSSVDTIRKTGATPLMNIDFKPRVLFPNIDQRVVDPSSYEQWDELIYQMVRHYRERGSGIQYWEVANEPDIGEDGGCPYLFTPGKLYTLLPAHGERHPPRRSRGKSRRASPRKLPLADSSGASRFRGEEQRPAELRLLAHLQQRSEEIAGDG